jgi:hypothetical protein
MVYKACIVETRFINNIIDVIKDHLFFLPPKYSLQIFASIKNKSQFENIDFGRKTEIIILENDINSLLDYNKLMTSLDFWKKLNCDKVLIFQSDSGLLRSGIEEFEEYDWVGDPWPDSGWSKGKPWLDGSNGGLSLVTVNKMIECIEKYPWNGLNEDAYFSLLISQVGGKTSREMNYKFSVESEYKLGTLGYHAIDKWLTKDQVMEIKNQYINKIIK